MAKKLIIYGASNYSDEVVQMFRDITGSKKDNWNIYGFIDDDPDKTGNIRNGIKVLGTRDWLKNNDLSEYYFILAIGNPKAKEKIVASLDSYNVKFATGIHPSVIMSDYISIGEGTIISAGNILTTNIKLGKHIIINLSCTIGHYCEVDDYCTINPGVNMSGDVTLKKGVLLGTNCTIIEKNTIGENSIIGAGAVVSKDIPDNVIAVGIPAKIIKEIK